MDAAVVGAMLMFLIGMAAAFALGALSVLATVRSYSDNNRWHAMHEAHLDAQERERDCDLDVPITPARCEICGVNSPDIIIRSISGSSNNAASGPSCIAICRECQKEYRESVSE